MISPGSMISQAAPVISQVGDITVRDPVISLACDIVSAIPMISQVRDIMGRFAVISLSPAITGGPMIS